jgi:hypothetical protein
MAYWAVRGPSYAQFEWRAALDVLFEYLTDSSVSPLRYAKYIMVFYSVFVVFVCLLKVVLCFCSAALVDTETPLCSNIGDMQNM